MTRPHRVGLIGLGRIAQTRHAAALRRTEGLTLVGVADHHPRRAATFAAKHGLAHSAETERLADIPWLHEVDALVIATPPASHAPLAIEALGLGKHVLLEKPFALTFDEGEALAEAAESSGKILAICHNFLFCRAINRLLQAMHEGRLGALRRVSVVQYGNPARPLPAWIDTLPLGLFDDESPHFLSLLLHLAGGPLTLEQTYGLPGMNAIASKTPANIHLLFVGPQGLPLTVDCHYQTSVSEWHVLVSGEKGLAILDLYRDLCLILPDDGAHRALNILRTSCSTVFQHFAQQIPNAWALLQGRMDYGHDEVYRRFAAAVASGTPPEAIGLQEAKAALRLGAETALAIQESMIP